MALFAVAGQAAMDTAGVALGGGAMKQAQDMFNAQSTQNKRYFAASWVSRTAISHVVTFTFLRPQAETSWRHGEALAQAEQHHRDRYDYFCALWGLRR